MGTASCGCTASAPRSVHPHVRGDGVFRFCISRSNSGSPPRAWGRHAGAFPEVPDYRFTPTCVGTAGCACVYPTVGPVHPHVRGDGGKRLVASELYTVHPHVRGDGPRRMSLNASPTGSPPRAWGRRVQAPSPLPFLRFTPTCVGTALNLGSRHSIDTVHPHVRGDGPHISHQDRAHNGSPPRAWGRRCPVGLDEVSHRFTPTCVGTAVAWARTFIVASVHPHVRGDGVLSSRRPSMSIGSPPRAWGRRRGGRSPRQCRRFTPTCVGTATRITPSTVKRTVHPHVRGDGL